MTQERLAFDRASARTFDKFGRMHVANCRVSKANVCPYFGREIPNFAQLGLDANRVYKLYRDPEELQKAAPTFKNAQLLLKHVGVSAGTPQKDKTIGTVGTIAFDGTYLVADQLTVWSSDGIKLIETEEARELSAGYAYDADMTPGVTPDGVAFDGVMRNIMGNHVTIVPEGRAGRDILVLDSNPPEFSAMFKRPILLAQLLAAGVLAAPADDAARLALDEKLADMTERDAKEDPETGKPAKAKKAKGKAGDNDEDEDDGMAKDAQIEAAIAAKGYVTAEAAQQMANDAALAATTNAVKQVNELHAAREAVKPLVGVVAMDSAEAVYKFALDYEKIACDGVHVSAYPALVAQALAAKRTKGVAPQTTPALALDAVSAALPGLARVRAG